MSNQHQVRGNLAMVPPAQQGTTERATSFDRMRDSLASRPVYESMDGVRGDPKDPRRDLGPEILDAGAEIQLAYAAAVAGNSSRLADAGHREAGYIRKQMSGEAPVTNMDEAAVYVVTPERFVGYVDALRRMAERLEKRAGITFASAIADIGRRVAELSALYVEALQDGRITAEERQQMMELGATVKTLLADIERHCAPKSERAQ